MIMFKQIYTCSQVINENMLSVLPGSYTRLARGLANQQGPGKRPGRQKTSDDHGFNW